MKIDDLNEGILVADLNQDFNYFHGSKSVASGIKHFT